MIFEKDLLSLSILDVLYLDQKNVSMMNVGRNFDAISFRIRSDACLKTDKSSHQMGNGSVCFSPANLNYRRDASMDELIVIHFHTAERTEKNIITFTPHNTEKFSMLFKKILNRWEKAEIGYKYECTSILYEIFAECHRQYPPKKTSKIQPSVDYLTENYTSPELTIKDVADKSFISEVYFRKLFKEEFGISPQKYITKLKIQRAVFLMSTGYYSLKEIALMSGYEDYKYFSVEFKREKGISPSKYVYNYHI